MSIYGYKRRREERKRQISLQQKLIVLLLAGALSVSVVYFIQREERYRFIIAQMADRSVVGSIMESAMELGVDREGQATVLFCDIRGFTRIMEGMDPREAVDFINKHMTELAQSVYTRGGVVDKFNGDRIMTIFDQTDFEESDARQAACCALDMVKIRNHLNEISGVPAKVGLGIASGRVVAGYLGSPNHKNYTIMGRCVNVAAVLCNQAEPDEILIDEDTYHLIGDVADVERVDDLILDGLKPIAIYKLIRLGDATSS